MPTTWGGAPRDDEQSILRDLGDLLSNKVKRLVCRICWVFEIGALRTPRREGYAHGDTVLGRAILVFGDWVILGPVWGRPEPPERFFQENRTSNNYA